MRTARSTHKAHTAHTAHTCCRLLRQILPVDRLPPLLLALCIVVSYLLNYLGVVRRERVPHAAVLALAEHGAFLPGDRVDQPRAAAACDWGVPCLSLNEERVNTLQDPAPRSQDTGLTSRMLQCT